MRDAKPKLCFTDKKVFLCDHSNEEKHFLQKTQTKFLSSQGLDKTKYLEL